MSFEPREYVQHILQEIDYLLAEKARSSVSDFLADETLKRAFVRSLEVIGEASKHVPQSLRDAYPRIEWRSMAAMRDRLVHGYFGVDHELVWDVIAEKLPVLKVEIERMLADLSTSR